MCFLVVFNLVKIISVILIAGGAQASGGPIYPSEEYDPAPFLLQVLGKGRTRERRVGSTFCNNFLCGGRGASSDRSCEKFDGENFEPLPVSLLGRREFHMCWGLKSGEVILLGGHNSPTTSEVVSADGTSSSPSFNLTTETS